MKLAVRHLAAGVLLVVACVACASEVTHQSASDSSTTTAPPKDTDVGGPVVDARDDVDIACTPEEVIFGYKTNIALTVRNSGSAMRSYRVVAAVADGSGAVLDREAEWFAAVEPGESRTENLAIRTSSEPSKCVVVSAAAS